MKKKNIIKNFKKKKKKKKICFNPLKSFDFFIKKQIINKIKYWKNDYQKFFSSSLIIN